jgi:hypothetical protein
MATDNDQNNDQLQYFINRVEKIYEVEYGDFKRKISQYVQRLEKSLPAAAQANPANRKIIGEIRRRVVYDPRPDIELARAEVIELAKQIKT